MIRRFIPCSIRPAFALLMGMALASVIGIPSLDAQSSGGGVGAGIISPGDTTTDRRLADSASGVTIDQVDLSRFPSVAIRFRASRAGRSLNGLLASDLRATLGGALPDSVSLERVVPTSDSLRIVLVVDRSLWAPAAERERAVLLGMIDRLAAHDRLALLRVGDSVERVLDFSPPAALREAFKEIVEPVPFPVLWQGANLGTWLARNAPPGRRNVVLVAMGPAGDVDLARVQVASRARTRGVPIHTLSFGPRADPLALSMLALESQGTAHDGDGDGAVREIVGIVTADIATDYRLGFVVPEAWREREAALRFAISAPTTKSATDSLIGSSTFVATKRSFGDPGEPSMIDGFTSPTGSGLPALIAITIVLTLLTLGTFISARWARARVGLAILAILATAVSMFMAYSLYS